MSYTISFANGDPDQSYETLDECKTAITNKFGEDVEIGHDGDLESFGDRTLFWASSEASEDDDGARALGAIKTNGASLAE